MASAPFEQLDFIYTPSTDVATEAKYFTEVLGARLAFAIQDGANKVAMLRLSDEPPAVLLTDHLEGERPILIYRVPDLKRALDDMEARGWKRAETFEIPQGPCCSLHTPGRHRIALYELARPEVGAHFEGRFDF